MKMNVKVPKQLINTAKLYRAVENGLTGEAKAVLVDLKVTSQTWKHEPTFVTESKPGMRRVYTDDEVYSFVDAGTDPHIITAKSPTKPLTFGVGGAPKTTPKVIGSRTGTKGSQIVRAQVVHHPGTSAREFTETIARKWDDRLPDILQRSIDASV